MSHRCGHLLASGEHCLQPVHDPSRTDCGRHSNPGMVVPGMLNTPDEQGCNMQQVAPGAWRCLTHADAPEWETARAMGARPPCRIPLSSQDLITLSQQRPLNITTAELLLNETGVAWVEELRSNLAANPSAPREVLEELARDPACVASVAANPRTPEALLRELARTPALAESLASNPELPTDLLQSFFDQHYALKQRNTDAVVLRRLIIHPRAPVSFWQRAANNNDQWVRARLGEVPDLPAAILAQLARDGEYTVREVAAGHRNTPKEALRTLVDEPHMHRHLVLNPGLPSDLLGQLCDAASDGDVRVQAAFHPNITPEILGKLAVDRLVRVRQAAAESPVASPTLLQQLASDTKSSVRAVVAAHRSCPPEALGRLAQDPHQTVRAAVLDNPAAPDSALEKLVAQEWDYQDRASLELRRRQNMRETQQ